MMRNLQSKRNLQLVLILTRELMSTHQRVKLLQQDIAAESVARRKLAQLMQGAQMQCRSAEQLKTIDMCDRRALVAAALTCAIEMEFTRLQH